jgi:AraC-like DNA-binding protein
LTFAAILEAIETAETNPSVEHPKIAFCKQYIHNNLNETTLCVKTLARQTECTPNYLSSLFHAHTGVRITDFLNSHRLDRAKDLLIHSTMNISEIARACGYTDPAYMTRRFAKTFHLSPRTYRTKYHAALHTF